MDNLFVDFLYRLVNWLYCYELDEYLSGIDPDSSTYFNFHNVGYPMLGWITIIISFVFVTLYYWYDNAGKNQFKHWLIWGVIGGFVNLCISTWLCYKAVLTGDMLQFGMVVDFPNCLMLGFANLLLTLVFYFLFSLIGKMCSTNCRRTPF